MVQGAKKYVTKPTSTSKAGGPRKPAAANRRGARDIAPKKAGAVMDQLVTRKLEKAIRGHIETQMKEKSGIKVFHVLAPVHTVSDKKSAAAGKKTKKISGTGKIIRELTAQAEKAPVSNNARARDAASKALSADIAAAVQQDADDDDDSEDSDEDD